MRHLHTPPHGLGPCRTRVACVEGWGGAQALAYATVLLHGPGPFLDAWLIWREWGRREAERRGQGLLGQHLSHDPGPPSP